MPLARFAKLLRYFESFRLLGPDVQPKNKHESGSFFYFNFWWFSLCFPQFFPSGPTCFFKMLGRMLNLEMEPTICQLCVGHIAKKRSLVSHPSILLSFNDSFHSHLYLGR